MREILFRGFHKGFHKFKNEEFDDSDGSLFCSDVDPTEIILDGKKVKGIWLVGNLISDKYEDPLIVGNSIETCDEYVALEWWAPVISETVGQFTGIVDNNGKKIFDGDIVKITFQTSGDSNYLISWSESDYRWVYNCLSKELPCQEEQIVSIEYIGNIYDNSELVENNN